MSPVQARIHASQSDYFDGTHTLVDGRHVLQPMTPPQRKLREQQRAMHEHVVKSASTSTSGTSSSRALSSAASTSSGSSGPRSTIGRKLKSLTWGSKKLLASAPAAPSSLSQSTLAPSQSSDSTRALERPTTPKLMRPPASPMSPNSPFTGAEQRHSTLVAFPRPPVPQQHAVSAILPSRELFQKSDSASIVSTHKTTSSFASSSLFMHTDDEDGSYSEATSISSLSSVNSAKLWRLKGLSDAPTLNGAGGLLAVQEVDEDNLSVAESRRASRRNSASVADFVAAMLAAPDTPERPRRWSASSAHPMRDSPKSRDVSASDGDDEGDLPARFVTAKQPRQQSTKPVSAFNGPRWTPGHSVRIPSMRFDGLAMDQAFEEIEKRVEGSPRRRAPVTNSELKSHRRRTRVLSTYRPTSTLPDALQVHPLSPQSKVERGTLTLSADDLESLRAPSPNPSIAPSARDVEARHESLLEQMMLGPDTARPALSASKRTLVRPAPVDVELANLTFFGPVQEGPRSRSPSGRSPRARSPMSAQPASVGAPLLSPLVVNTARVSAPAVVSKSTLGTPISLVSDKPTQIATTPTSPIPKVCIFAPNSQLAQSSSEAESLAAIERGTIEPKVTTPMSVKVVEPKRVVRMSTRAPPRPNKSLRRKPSLPLLDASKSNRIESRSKTPPLPSPSSVLTSTPRLVDFKRSSAASSAGSDCEAQLDNLLNKLNQPYSPPAPVRSSPRPSPTIVVESVAATAVATTPIKRDFSEDSLSRESPLRPRVFVTDADAHVHDRDELDEDEDERKRLTILRQHDDEMAERSEQDRVRLDEIAQMMMAAATQNGRWTPTNCAEDESTTTPGGAGELVRDASPALESPVDPSMRLSTTRVGTSSSPEAVAAPATYKSRPLSAVFEEEDDVGVDTASVYSDDGRALPELVDEQQDDDVQGAESPSSLSRRSSGASRDVPRLAPAAIIFDPIEQEINATLASIESHPAFDPSMFSFNTAPQAPSSAVAPSDSFTSSRSSIAYLAGSPKTTLSHSRTISSDLNSMFSQDDLSSVASSPVHRVVATRYVSHYRRPSLAGSRSSVGALSESSGSFDEASELGVVMMGQRVSCTYEVGLAL
ncbi:hypothetical protein OIV83_005959 [Microbotryomycetes sp. JL201]|nr:hypothetical protein OIV83_005959 [Microbotryomycetes sp. JL201]